ncbi:hypothetical protein NM208_g3182 [Fusarium decemcellulare]|uniref:Uncharacterized protein n=1 Tax=Fusarium decemcellulare TaxID=57161 RepID=A0ACC1SQ56_9HYPO|nr:hypothetical protein NM208_g3182 [Fusarium decemcellulare]
MGSGTSEGSYTSGYSDAESSAPESSKERQPPVKIIPAVKKVNFEGFTNRFSPDEDLHIIDVLIATDELREDILYETERRKNLRIIEKRLGKAKSRSGRDEYARLRNHGPAASTQPEEGGWVQRVRIRSEAILYHLSEALDEGWATKAPLIFHRPFSAFIAAQHKMKKILLKLELAWGRREPDNAVGSEKGVKDGAIDDSKPDYLSAQESRDLGVNSAEALRHMRCYVKFVDEEILPLVGQFEGTERTKARFDDLWFMFKLGDLVYAPNVTTPPNSVSNPPTMYQTLWRISRLDHTNVEHATRPAKFPLPPANPTPQSYLPPPPTIWMGSSDIYSDLNRILTIEAYYIDYDGTSYGPVKQTFNIWHYRGERDITTLPCYPIRYFKGWEAYLEEQEEQGRRFESSLTNKHLSYSGWTLISQPNGRTPPRRDGSIPERRHAEYVDSHVFIDFAEAFHDDPESKPMFHGSVKLQEGSDGDLDYYTWADRERSSLCSRTIESIHVARAVAVWQQAGEFNKNKFYNSFLERRSRTEGRAPIKLEDHDYALLPRRMFAYALRDRKFVMVDVRFLSAIPRQDNVFKNLKIDKEYKQMVKGLVASHLRKKQLEKEYPGAIRANQSQDIIYGKGRGLVILLHGVPGVGKTATAEAAAFEYGKPLFAITCGDLGLTPKEVEESLTNIFRLAHLWQCVLLFDEADVFLAQRSRYDLTRNALVSVFLRILEYYNGILFLTTNRVGTLDEAFKSRIHMSLYYPPLNSIQVKLIFEMNLKKLAETERERYEVTGEPELDINESAITNFVDAHLDKTKAPGGWWNGRQIRNAFQIASSLARYHALEEEELEMAEGKELTRKRPVLDDTQFQKVERATETFKEYLEKTRGFSDADLAHILGDRDDLYRQGKLFGGLAEGTGAGYQGTGAHMPRYQHPGGSYGQGMHPEFAGRAGGSAAPNVDFPAMNLGPMTYGYNESSRQPGLSHDSGSGMGGYPTVPQQHPRPDPTHFQTPMPSMGQSGDPFTTSPSRGPRQGYGNSMNPGHNYLRGGHPSEYESGGHLPPQQLRRSPAPDESRYD